MSDMLEIIATKNKANTYTVETDQHAIGVIVHEFVRYGKKVYWGQEPFQTESGDPYTVVNINQYARKLVVYDYPRNCISPLLERTTLTIYYQRIGSPIFHIQSPNSITGPKVSVQVIDKSDCFVVTATFGTPEAIEVYRYRNFRDRYLMRHTLGRNFIKVYYRVGPWLAKIVKDNIILKYFSRKLLGIILLLLPVDVD